MSQLPIVGRPVTPAIPPWKKRIETSWPLCPVCIERITQMSSTIPAVSGSSSETSVPHCPCLANFQGLPNSFLLARLTKLNTTSPPYSVPCRFDSSGLGSSRSTCDGPPCMNSEIIAFALGAKCGARGLQVQREVLAGLLRRRRRAAPSWRSRWARANAPTPKAVFARNARRVGKGGSVDIEKLVGGQELLAEIRQDGELAIRTRRSRAAGEPYSLTHAASSGVIARW